MASEVFDREEVTLQDGETVELRPLVIGKLRKFHKDWNNYLTEVTKLVTASKESESETVVAETEDKINDMQYDVFIQLCKYGLADLKQDKTEKQFTEYLEGVLDEPTIYKVLEVTGSLKLNEGGQNLTQGPATDQVGTN